MANERLPLFPLGQPLFPGIRLELQILEQRYLRLIRQSMREESEFGIVATEDSIDVGEHAAIYDFGLAVKVVDWKQLENGLLSITVCGEKRFNLHSTETEEDGLVIGQVEWLPERPEPENCSESSLLVMESLLRDLAQHPALNWVSLPEQMSVSDLGWKLAQVLPAPTVKRVQLLAESSAIQRLAKIQILIDELSNI